MGSRAQPNKVLLDIEDCVLELKRQSVDGKTPINDDSATLHRFQEKLEFILCYGLIEKPIRKTLQKNLLGGKKSYWNYICACFASSKRNHDGINFVKSVVALKTPLGHGRAFIRFCLTQKCLADTLQSCFMNQKISREYYTETSVPVQEKLWSTLVASLYDLNELNFDLSAGHTELDISWPKFAWKLFSASDTENLPPRNMSTPNLHSFSLQDEFISDKPNSDSLSYDIGSYSSYPTVNVDADELAELNTHLSQENESLLKQVESLKKEKENLQCNIEALQKQCYDLHQQLQNTLGENHPVKSYQGKFQTNSELVDSSFVSSETSKVESSKNISCEPCMNMPEENKRIPSPFEASSMKLKPENYSLLNSSECALQSNSESPTLQKMNLEICCHDPENSVINRYISQNPIYINELLLEVKTVIDDIEDTIQKSDGTLAIPHISRLKKIKNCLENLFSSGVDRSKSNLSFNNFIENCISCIKTFTTKQENIINSLQEKVDLSIKGNHTLYSKIRTLKELLLSYGFLKVTDEKDLQSENLLLPLDSSNVLPKFSSEDLPCDIAHDPVLKRLIVPLLPVLNSSFTKLNSLYEKMIELQFGLDSSQELNNHLIIRVQDQEMHLKGVTKEIEEAQQLVSVLKKQHRKLQSAEGIFKYDLQEKRKLLTRLKQQLENTREDFNLVRIKNSKSEAEWQDLHNEFAQRHKQASEESGFEEQEAVFSNSPCSCSFTEESKSTKESINKNFETLQTTKKKRLALLEEQCQKLFSSLLQSSQKRQEIDKRLEIMCKTIEKNSEHIQSSTFTPADSPAENILENINGAVIQMPEDDCQNIMFTNDAFTNSPPSSSDVGSLNSECSSCLPSICNDANSSDSSLCESSKADSCISFSPSTLQTNVVQPLTTNVKLKEANLCDNSDFASGYNSEYKCGNGILPPCESIEQAINNIQNLEVQSMSHVDSILIKKKDLEESLKNLEIDNEIASTDKRRHSHSDELHQEICILQNEKQHLLNKMEELERKIVILSTELDQTTQQLLLSKAAKEHEVAALQFQLHTEALKYERALKEFSEQNVGLENMKLRVSEQEELILALEKALTEIHSDRENEKEQRWLELEDIHIALEAREQECMTLCQELEKSMSETEEEHGKNIILLSQLEECKSYNQKDRECMEAEILTLKQYSRELQKKLVKLLKEKDILWKRNDHLHYLQKIKIDNRWMNDSEVSSCLACKNNFSFVLRKHHCRLCGRIFCYSCANNWLMTASSSKKIRTCNECFMQHMEMKKVVRRGSDVPHIDESDDEYERENGDLSMIPRSSCSFNSEAPSSITNSIISLPITQKHSVPHFASAPDLRYAYKPYEATSCSVSLAEENFAVEEEQIQMNNHVSSNCDQKAEISSDECTSITLEDDDLKTSRLEEISIDAIIKSDYGISDKLTALSGERVDLPILCQTYPVILEWSFTSNCQNIPLTITHESDSISKILYQATDKMQDLMELSLSGYYVFHFDNTTRNTEMEVQYTVQVKHLN